MQRGKLLLQNRSLAVIALLCLLLAISSRNSPLFREEEIDGKSQAYFAPVLFPSSFFLNEIE